MDDIRLASLLCSRLCHDLVSPVGAIVNGLELMAEESDEAIREQAQELLQRSAEQTSSRLQFFRYAFGASGGLTGETDCREVTNALGDFVSEDKVELDWQIKFDSLPKLHARLILTLGLMVAEALVRGGRLTVRATEQGGAIQYIVEGQGDRVIFQDAIQAALEGRVPLDDLEARSAPAYLARQLAGAADGEISIATNEEGRLGFTATLPKAFD